MNRAIGSLAMLVGLALVLAVPGAAGAQEWKIYLVGKTEPIVADYYAEQAPWIFYHDDQSMYLFAVGCDRIERVERAGAALPSPACPVDRLPTTAALVYLNIIDLESKRLEDEVKALADRTRAYAEAVVGSAAVARSFVQAGGSEGEAAARTAAAVATLQSQIDDTLFSVRLAERRIGALMSVATSFPPRERPRYFFAPR